MAMVCDRCDSRREVLSGKVAVTAHYYDQAIDLCLQCRRELVETITQWSRPQPRPGSWLTVNR